MKEKRPVIVVHLKRGVGMKARSVTYEPGWLHMEIETPSGEMRKLTIPSEAVLEVVTRLESES